MTDIRLTLAIADYDHVRDLTSGAVTVEGVDLTCLDLRVDEIFFRFSKFREWEVSEMSLGKFVALSARGSELAGIPVFPSRVFRHSALFVRAEDPISSPSELAGARIGVPEWSQTATVWVRGLLSDGYGVDLRDVSWFQGGVNQPGRVEGIDLDLPEGIELTPIKDRTLNEMLVAGELDAVISARPPLAFVQGDGEVRRLFSDPRTVERDYHAETGVFPIMHVVVIREDVYAEHPWVAMNLMKAFEAAKRRGVERALDPAISRYPLPWGATLAAEAHDQFGPDLWPYGIEPNRATLEAFLRFAHEQGLTARRLEPEGLFVPEVRERYRE